jgi:hypothetical protein
MPPRIFAFSKLRRDSQPPNETIAGFDPQENTSRQAEMFLKLHKSPWLHPLHPAIRAVLYGPECSPLFFLGAPARPDAESTIGDEIDDIVAFCCLSVSVASRRFSSAYQFPSSSKSILVVFLPFVGFRRLSIASRRFSVGFYRLLTFPIPCSSPSLLPRHSSGLREAFLFQAHGALRSWFRREMSPCP